jgi:RNA polymerase sigma-70 factor (sigma-E family)
VAVRGEAFEGFVTAASPRLLRLAILLVGDRGAAEDLLQEVLERMYVAWPRIAEPEAYARQALAHRATNRWRHRSRRPEVALTDEHDVTVPGPEPSQRDSLLAALAALTDRQRTTVVLRFFEDFTVEQTAAAMNCSVGTVKSQTARALPRLREMLALPEDSCP